MIVGDGFYITTPTKTGTMTLMAELVKAGTCVHEQPKHSWEKRPNWGVQYAVIRHPIRRWASCFAFCKRKADYPWVLWPDEPLNRWTAKFLEAGNKLREMGWPAHLAKVNCNDPGYQMMLEQIYVTPLSAMNLPPVGEGTFKHPLNLLRHLGHDCRRHCNKSPNLGMQLFQELDKGLQRELWDFYSGDLELYGDADPW